MSGCTSKIIHLNFIYRTFIRRRILFVIIFFAGGLSLLLFSQILNYFGIKSLDRIKDNVTYKTDSNNFEPRRNLNRMLENGIYCNISSCQSVSCSFIPAFIDSGKEASHFIENTFKVRI